MQVLSCACEQAIAVKREAKDEGVGVKDRGNCGGDRDVVDKQLCAEQVGSAAIWLLSRGHH